MFILNFQTKLIIKVKNLSIVLNIIENVIKSQRCGFFYFLDYIYFVKMFLKGLLIVLLASAVFAYEKEGNVLVLHDADFPKVI